MKFIAYKPANIFVPPFDETTYLQSFLIALLKVCGAEVELINSPSVNNIFIRDHFVLTPNGIVIGSKSTKNIDEIRQQLNAAKIHELDYKWLESTRFVGGNVVIVPREGNPILYYANHDDDELRQKAAALPQEFSQLPLSINAEEFIRDLQQSQQTKKSVQLKQISFKLLKLAKPTALREKKIFENFYYHLDCFMAALPNGKVILLNKNFFTEEALRELETTIGKENIIDLDYADYLTKPIMLNLVVIPLMSGQYLLLNSHLPDTLIQKLESLDFFVITPASFTSTHHRYDSELANRVSEILQSMGWKTTPDKLLTGRPVYQADYSLSLIKNMIKKVNSGEKWLNTIPTTYPAQHFLLSQAALRMVGTTRGTRPIPTEKETLREFLQHMQTQAPQLTFDFSGFDTAPHVPDTIPLCIKGDSKPVDFIAATGSFHCLLQEYPHQVGGKITLFSPVQPNFTPKRDFALFQRYKTVKEFVLPPLNTALRRAAAMGHLDDVKLLIARSANPNDQATSNGRTALHHACANGHYPVIEYLRKIGAAIDIKDRVGNTPFDLLLAFDMNRVALETSQKLT